MNLERVKACKTIDELCDVLDEISPNRNNNYDHGDGLRAQMREPVAMQDDGTVRIAVFVPAWVHEPRVLRFSLEYFVIDADGNIV